jgi:hypothetical protein
MSFSVRFIRWWGAAPAVFLAVFGLPAWSDGAAVLVQCPPPVPGRYLVLGSGFFEDQPIARLLQEEWRANGVIDGLRFNRDGDQTLEQGYQGRWMTSGSCQARVDRQNGRRMSHTMDFLDPNGRPKLALSLTPGSTLNKRYWSQSTKVCNRARFAGNYLVDFAGQVRKANQWHPYVAMMKLRIDSDLFAGVLISSVNGQISDSKVNGELSLESNCFGLLRWTGPQGGDQVYRVVAEATGHRILAVSQDPELVSVGVLERQ